MHKKKSWVLLLLLAFTLNVLHGFLPHHHTHTDTTLHQDEVSIVQVLTHQDSCDECPCFHLNLILNETAIKLPQITPLKPQFQLLSTLPLLYTLTLDKPPTT